MAAIRQRNVQEQNEDTQKRIRAHAAAFAVDPLRFSWLLEILQAQSLSPQHGILVALSHIPEQGSELYEGVWLTHEKQFFQFAVLIPRSDAELDLEEWRDVTAQTVISAHQPGTGKSFGSLALEVLRDTVAALDSNAT